MSCGHAKDETAKQQQCVPRDDLEGDPVLVSPSMRMMLATLKRANRGTKAKRDHYLVFKDFCFLRCEKYLFTTNQVYLSGSYVITECDSEMDRVVETVPRLQGWA